MRLLVPALAVTLSALSSATAAEIVVLKSGERMDVESFEVQSSFVVVKTWDGRLRSLPMAYVDLAATESANEHAEIAERIAPDRLEKARIACEAFGVSSAVANYDRVLNEQIQRFRGHMSIVTFDEMRAAFRNAFDDERSFDLVVAHLARGTNPDLLDELNEWLSDSYLQQMIAIERVPIEGDEVVQAQRYLARLTTDPAARARREALIARLEAAREQTRSGVEVVLYLVKAFFEAGNQIFPDEPIEYDEEEMRRVLAPALRESVLLGMAARFRDIGDAELERYVSHWETSQGKRVARFLNAALESGAMEGSDVAVQILTGKRQTVP